MKRGRVCRRKDGREGVVRRAGREDRGDDRPAGPWKELSEFTCFSGGGSCACDGVREVNERAGNYFIAVYPCSESCQVTDRQQL